jgi:hypothetical protein
MAAKLPNFDCLLPQGIRMVYPLLNGVGTAATEPFDFVVPRHDVSYTPAGRPDQGPESRGTAIVDCVVTAAAKG